LRHRGGIGRDKARKLISLLIDVGYIRRRKVRDAETQAFVYDEYVVFDDPANEVACEPQPENPSQEPAPEKPAPANPTHNKDGKTVSTEYNPRSDEQGLSEQVSVPKPKRKRNSYTEAFEAFWKAYPTTPNMSKAEAFKEWLRLTEADQHAAIASLPAYRRDLAKEEWRKPVYACRYLKQRRFEGFAQSADLTKPDAMDWPRHCDLAIKTCHWPRAWGPAPGKPGCLVPADLVTSRLVNAVNGRRTSA
jgi:hypothetical protein